MHRFEQCIIWIVHVVDILWHVFLGAFSWFQNLPHSKLIHSPGGVDGLPAMPGMNVSEMLSPRLGLHEWRRVWSLSSMHWRRNRRARLLDEVEVFFIYKFFVCNTWSLFFQKTVMLKSCGIDYLHAPPEQNGCFGQSFPSPQDAHTFKWQTAWQRFEAAWCLFMSFWPTRWVDVECFDIWCQVASRNYLWSFLTDHFATSRMITASFQQIFWWLL